MCMEPSRLVCPTLAVAVRRQMDVAVDPHGHQGMPVLHLDLGDVADVDVGDPDPGVLLDDDHVGQLRLDGVRTVARCPRCPAGSASSAPATHTPVPRTGTRRRAAAASMRLMACPRYRRQQAAPSNRSVPDRDRSARAGGRSSGNGFRRQRWDRVSRRGSACGGAAAAGPDRSQSSL